MQPMQKFSGGNFAAQKVAPIALQETSRLAYGLPVPTMIGSAKGDRRTATLKSKVQPSTPETLFSALADAKVWTSCVSMYLSRETRDRIFRQLDVLHDVEEWYEGDSPVNLASYKTLIRAIVFHKVDCRPAISIMPNGNVLALWQDGPDKLTVEFQPQNRARWLVQSHTENGPERATGSTALERLRQVLEPYGAARWFNGR